MVRRMLRWAWVHPALPHARVLIETNSAIRKDCPDGCWHDGSMPENRSCPADVGQSEDRRNEDDRKSARGIAGRSSRHGRVNEPTLFKIGRACIAVFSDKSAVDAVDGSSTGTAVPWMWALLRLPRFRGASHADDNDNWFRHRQVGFPGSWRRCCRTGGDSPSVEARYVLSFLRSYRHAWSGLKLAARPTIGLASSRRWVIRCG